MKKLLLRYLACVLLFLCVYQSHAQDKKALALGNSTNPARLSTGDVAAYEGAAVSGVRQTKICTILERTEWESILKERGIQQTEDFLDGNIIQQNVSLGAEYLLLLSFQSFDVTENKNIASKNRSVNASLLINAKLASVETGEVKHSKTMTLKESNSFSPSSSMYGVAKAVIANSFKEDFIKKVEKALSKFIYEAFPPAITILSVEDSKKGKAKKVLCKTSATLIEGNRMNVYTEEEIDLGDGEKEVIKNNIGELRIEDVKSSRVVSCSVKKGGDKILDALNNKVTLKCIVINKKGMFDDLMDNF